MSRSVSTHTSFHRYRLHVIATWPESGCKQAALAAAKAALERDLVFERAARIGGAPADHLGARAVHSARPAPL